MQVNPGVEVEPMVFRDNERQNDDSWKVRLLVGFESKVESPRQVSEIVRPESLCEERQ